MPCLVDLRVQGVREHYARAQWFLDSARSANDDVASFRLLLASLYSARAIVEIMLEAAARQQIPGYCGSNSQAERKRFEETLRPTLPRYELVEKIRIHDFHRFGLVPPDARFRAVSGGGPYKLIAAKGKAVLPFGPRGPQEYVSGDSQVKKQRSLEQDDSKFFDESSGAYVPLLEVVTDYLEAVPRVVKSFETLVSPNGNDPSLP